MKKLLFLIFLPFITFSQCQKEELNDPDGQYIYNGCLNDANQYDGFGKLTFTSGELKYYEGLWDNGIFINGEVFIDFESQTQLYIGDFLNNKYHGEGYIVVDFLDGTIQTKKGEFKSGILFTGKEERKFEDGALITTTIEYAEITNTIDNRVNYYNPNDILCKNSESIINLVKRNSSLYLDLKFSGIAAEGLFDTGAFGLSIGKRLFKRLKDSGVTYKETDMKQEVVGNFGRAQVPYVIFDEISIGECIIKNVIAVLNLQQDHTLVGMQFFDKFNNAIWNMKENTIELYQ